MRSIFYSVDPIQFFKVEIIIHILGKVKEKHLFPDSFTQRTLGPHSASPRLDLRMYSCREQRLVTFSSSGTAGVGAGSLYPRTVPGPTASGKLPFSPP